ncbi:MAG: HU family DNA-binding protein [Cypionkella sp.]
MATKPAPTKTTKPATKPELVRKIDSPQVVADDDMPMDEAAGVVRDDSVLRMKALVDRVTDASGAKRKDVKTIVEAALIALGATLASGQSMNLPGLGHMRVAKKATPEVPAMTLKLRQGEAGKGKSANAADAAVESDEKEALAEESDQG